MAAVSTMILRSMRMIGEKQRGGTLDANEQVECLAELNTFMESLSNERLMCYSITEDVATLTTSTAVYSIGPGGDINTTRPTKIVDPCFIRDSSGYDYQVNIVDLDAYGSIVVKSTGYTYPTYLYYDAGFSATSTGTIRLYPSPSQGLELHLNSWKQMQNFASLSTTVLFPPGYQLMIESNFAIHLAAGFVDPPAAVVKIARDSKASIKSLNLPSPVMRPDIGVHRSGMSILTGP